MTTSATTTDHDTIKSWVEARRGHPSRVRAEGEGGILRIDFGKPEENLEKIGWEEFFQIFDERKLAFLYQDETAAGEKSRFNKFISRDGGS
ncbi:hypothetical protein [Gellertiella hungarica]|uniref:1,4-alpha-glucan branching enzyme n=1 Tax=Gellertiella hungarica TaxID=1572859 RepID=A0A7W6NMP7_9HYPH|nr:hypothetical protein [Gellertiella hungarica]MBB4067208.1 hypothetical protein [Gellertiella hungarica]